jgi:hypothetical protein
MFVICQAAAKEPTMQAAGGNSVRVGEYVMSAEFRR